MPRPPTSRPVPVPQHRPPWKHNLCFFLYYQFLLLSMMLGGVGCPLARAVLAVLPLNLLPTPGLLAVRGREGLDTV